MPAVRPSILVALLAICSTQAHAQFETNESKAQRLLNRNHKGVLNVAQLGAIYVSVDMKLFRGTEFQRPAPGQFCYRCTYTWNSQFGGSATSTIDFYFDESGRLYALDDQGTSSAFANFSTTDVVLDFLRNQLRNQMNNIQNQNDRAAVQLLIDNSRDSRRLLLELIKLDQRFGG